ncbi:hypothetical protein B0T14DRAFT_275323 [Immersiella caudata]|uniref:NACHT domain-containing protein n=1 Tax=Immersiella caudata TaxID=314043 RepID=A0AA39TIV0_9PEZI|nr:hypothetical protein B0T14DRAFT_275323 [Immersiella caudata]
MSNLRSIQFVSSTDDSMESVAALGIAAAVGQFLELASKLFRASQDVGRSGSAVHVAQLDNAAKGLRERAAAVTKSLNSVEPSTLNDEEKRLCALATECEKISHEVEEAFLHLRTHSPAKRWQSYRIALKSVWGRKKVEDGAKRVADCRSQLALDLLAVAHSQLRLQGHSMERLEDGNKQIVELLTTVIAKLDRRDAAFITGLLASSTLVSSFPDVSPRDTNQPEVHDGPRSATHGLSTRDAHQTICNALLFRGMSDRREAISTSHNRTFSWIWDQQLPGQYPWDDLADWLRHGRGCYWLFGKPGSGKSTLMKYLESHAETLRCLRAWADEGTAYEGHSDDLRFAPETDESRRQLIIGSFYFWYAGSEIQNSLVGLLRSLLYRVLSSYPSLSSVIFPELYELLLAGKVTPQSIADLTETELRCGFSKLMKSPKTLRIFFYVDGLDEYTGDQDEIYRLLTEGAESETVKLLVSSRPVPACVGNFSHFPKLRLQDLIRGDILKYVRDTLGTSRLMRHREIGEPGLTARLVKEISAKSAGVFLWVRLVVRRIISCLQNHDTTDEIDREIERLPSDFERLYEHLLSLVPEQHRPLGSKFLQMVVLAVERKCDLNALQLWFVERTAQTKDTETPTQRATMQQVEWRCRDLEGILNSRCFGLLEVWTKDCYTADRGHIRFLHRTVYEFLTLGPVWKRLTNLTAHMEFDPRMAILDSLLVELKFIQPRHLDDQVPGNRIDALGFRIHKAINYRKLFSNLSDGKVSYEAKLLEFQCTLQTHWSAGASLPFASSAEENDAITRTTRRATELKRLTASDTFLLWCLLRNPKANLYTRLEEDRLCDMVSGDLLLDVFLGEPDRRVQKAILRALKFSESRRDSLKRYIVYAQERLNTSGLVGKLSSDLGRAELASLLEMGYMIFETVDELWLNFDAIIVLARLMHALWGSYITVKGVRNQDSDPRCLTMMRDLDNVLVGSEYRGIYEAALVGALKGSGRKLKLKPSLGWRFSRHQPGKRAKGVSSGSVTSDEHAPWRASQGGKKRLATLLVPEETDLGYSTGMA